MSAAEKIFQPFLYVLRNHKKTILIIGVSAVLFTVVRFPYDDLADLITEQIAKNSQNQIFVQFDELGVGLLPPAIKMSKVSLDTPMLPTLKAGTLRLAPSIAGFLAFKPGFSASIEDVMKGDIALTYKAGKKINDTTRMQDVDLVMSKVDLKSLSSFAGLPVDLEGQISLDLDTQVDPNFIEQPDGDVAIKINKFKLPPSIPTMMGAIPTPNTEISSISLKGQLKGADFVIDEGQIGAAGDTINGRLKGHVGLRLVRQGNQIVPEWGAYEFKIDLSLDRAAEKNFGVFLGFYDKFKTITGTGSRYALKLTGANFMSPPEASPAGSF
jgi:type II secretion system protein N